MKHKLRSGALSLSLSLRPGQEVDSVSPEAPELSHGVPLRVQDSQVEGFLNAN